MLHCRWKDLADLGKGTSMDGPLKCSAMIGLKALVIKDRLGLYPICTELHLQHNQDKKPANNLQDST